MAYVTYLTFRLETVIYTCNKLAHENMLVRDTLEAVAALVPDGSPDAQVKATPRAKTGNVPLRQQLYNNAATMAVPVLQTSLRKKLGDDTILPMEEEQLVRLYREHCI